MIGLADLAGGRPSPGRMPAAASPSRGSRRTTSRQTAFAAGPARPPSSSSRATTSAAVTFAELDDLADRMLRGGLVALGRAAR